MLMTYCEQGCINLLEVQTRLLPQASMIEEQPVKPSRIVNIRENSTGILGS